MCVYYKRKNTAKQADDVNPLRAGAGLLGRELSDNPWQGTLTPRRKEGEMDVCEKKKKGQECWAVSFISHSGPKRHIPKGRCVAKPGSSVWMKRKPRMNTAFRQSTHSCCQERWIHTKLSSITGIFILFPRCGVRADMRPLEIWNSSKFYYRFLVVLVNWVSKK